MNAYKKLLALYGSDKEIAKAFKIKRQAISYWKVNGVPLCRAREVEKVTNGIVTVKDVMKP